jgi:hypothetical protein
MGPRKQSNLHHQTLNLRSNPPPQAATDRHRPAQAAEHSGSRTSQNYEKRQKSMKIHANLCKSMKIYENLWKSMEINENQ